MNFDEAFDRLLGHEGEYSFHKDDPGGETMWGVTYRVARQYGFTGEMRYLPRDLAKQIYRDRYWNVVRADDMPAGLRFDLFDAAVNSGPKQAVKWLQQVLGVADDGIVGPMTLKAARESDAKGIAAAINGERLDLMTSLPTWGAFGKGWARRIASNLKGLA